MKPSVIMGGKETATVVQPEVLEAIQTKSRLKTRVVLVTACLVMMCACGLSLGLYFGLKKGNGDTIVQNHVYFRERQGNTIPANVTVTRKEECFSFENAAVIYDFSTGIAVYKSKLEEEADDGCLVKSFNMTLKKKPSDLKTELKENEVLGATYFEQFLVTNIWLNEEALGPKSQDLCVDEEIRFVEKVQGNYDPDDDQDIEAEDLAELGDGDEPLQKKRVRRGGFICIRFGVRIGGWWFGDKR